MAHTRICTVPDCGKRERAKGLCSLHYDRQRAGVPLDAPLKEQGRDLRFLAGLLGTTETACIPWPYRKYPNGYGVTQFRGKGTTASRALCIMVHGEPPTPEHQAAHSCGRGRNGCINPNHIDWKTVTENHADKKVHGTYVRGSAQNGAKLTEAEVIEIKRLLALGVLQKYIAAIFDTNQSHISTIKRGVAWSWLT